MLRKVVRLVPGIGRYQQVQRQVNGFCSSSKTGEQKGERDDVQLKKPKWMKFFGGQEPMKIDLDRSMKSENMDLIHNYIKLNYTKFDDEQLVAVMPKVSRSPLIDKIKAEMRQRILSDSFTLTAEQGSSLIECLEDINYNDRVIVLYALTTVSEFMPDLTHIQLFRLIMLAVKINKISFPFAQSFLDQVNSFDRAAIVELFGHFDFAAATNYMYTLAQLKELLTHETFQVHVKESILNIIIEIYLEKMKGFSEQYEISTQTHLDKVFSADVLSLLNYEQKLAYKKIVVRTIELRFDNETHLGKFGFYRGDKSITVQKALSLMRQMVQSNERVLVQKCMVEIGNAILTKDQNDFKFDFRLFTHLTKYSSAYKFYIDESFISMKSLLRSQLYSTKKSLSEDADLNSYHVIFQKSKVYSELNYNAVIQNSEDVYARKVDFSDSMLNQWNQFQRDLQNCLKDYLTLQISSNFFSKVISRFPTQQEINSTEDNGDEEIIDSSDLNVLEDAEGIALTQEQKADERAYKQGEMYAGEWIQTDRNNLNALGGDSSAEFASAQSSANQREDEEYKKKVGYLLIEFQRKLQAKKYTKFVSFTQRATFTQTSYLRYFVGTVEIIAQSLLECEPNEEFLVILKQWLKQESLAEIIEHFGMIPNVLEGLLLIEAYGKIKHNQSWFSAGVLDSILKKKFTIEQLFTRETAYNTRVPAAYVQMMESEIASVAGGKLPIDRAYDPHHMMQQIINASFYVSPDRFEMQKQKVSESSDDMIRMQKKRDLCNEQFIDSKENVLRKVVHSQAFTNFVNESSLKKYTGDVLFNFSPATQKNVVYYPFFADFILPNHKTVVQIREKSRLLDGVENVLTGFHQQNEEFLKMLGYKVVYVDHTDFEIDFRAFQLNLFKKIFKSIS